MIEVGIADYELNVWYGNMYDYEWRLTMLKELGFDGIERLEATSADRALEQNALAAKMGMGFATCRGSNAADTLTFAAGLGKKYIGCSQLPKILIPSADMPIIKQKWPLGTVLKWVFIIIWAHLLKCRNN